MKSPLDKTDAEIIRTVNKLFGISVVSVEFIPLGEASWIYSANTDDGHRLIIKVQSEVSMATSEVLHELTHWSYKWMPKLYLSVAGRIWEAYEGLCFCVQEYVSDGNGYHANSEPTEEYLRKLGIALRDLHDIPYSLNDLAHVPIEEFNPPMVAMAQKSLERLHRYEGNNNTVIEVRSRLRGWQLNIDNIFANVKLYGDKLKGREAKKTIVHGDCHFGNILMPDKGPIRIIDWDHSMIALKEHDLMYFTDEHIKMISKGYGDDLLRNETTIMYYRNYLMVRAVWFWFNKLLDVSPDQKSEIVKTIYDVFEESPYLLRALHQ